LIRDKILKLPLWVIAPVLLFLFNVTIGFNGMYGQDSFEYLRYSRALHDYFTEGVLPGQFWWPVIYPLAGSLFSFFLPDILALQMVSIIGYGMTFYFLQKILLRIHANKASVVNLYLLLFFFLSPFVMRYSSTVMSESLATAFIVGFFYFYLLFIENKNHKHLLLAVFFGCAAINTRYASFMVLVVPGIHTLYLFTRQLRIKYLVYIILIVMIFFVPDFYLHLYQPGSISDQPHLSHWSFLNYFRRSFSTADGLLSYRFPNIAYVFSNLFYPGFIFAGGLMLIFFRLKTISSVFMKIIAATILFYALFLAGLTFQNDRILMLTFPCILLLLSGTYLELSEWVKRRKAFYFRIMVILVIIIQLGLFYRAFKPFYENSKTIKTVSERMLQYPDKPVYTFNIDMALKAYGVKNEIISLWDKKITDFQPGSLVLFNYTNTAEQWKSMNPMLNWEELHRAHQLGLLENLPGGWQLFEIEAVQ
jgi:hypothetical protein